jgi:hypothetical protein
VNVDSESPAFLRFYARVMIREYRARNRQPRWMIDAALRARRQAAAWRPAQQDLFA